MRGVIYVLLNPHYPKLVKIGRTARDLRQRVKELSRPTGVPGPFEIAYDAVVSDAQAAEREVHEALSDRREGKEFFRIGIRDAIRAVQRVQERYPVDASAESNEVEILPRLEHRMRRWLKKDVVSVKFVQYSDLCLLKITSQPVVDSRAALETVFDLRVLGDDCNCGNEHLFCPFCQSIEENVGIFVNELDVYSMLMVGIEIINEEADRYIAELREKDKVEPPLAPTYEVMNTKYEMWGSEDEWRPIVDRIRTMNGGGNRLTSDSPF